MLVAVPAWAQSTLKDVSYQPMPGGKVAVKMSFGGKVPSPKIFTTQKPPRIAIDFDDTRNAFAKRHLDIGEGATSGVSVVSAGGRTRVVVELDHVSNYHTHVQGDALVMTVANGDDIDPAATAGTVDPTKQLPVPANAPQVSDIDFRRSADGAGKVLIDFTGPGADVDMNQTDGKVSLNLSHVRVPERLAKRLDVLDFATPVQSVTTHPDHGGARMEVVFAGQVEASAYQTPKQYVLEIARKKKSDSSNGTELGKVKKPHYTGSRVTFNFQDIQVRSALQLLAQMSHLNMVAADSVTGSVTLRLEDVPWDQALDVILRAKGLDKRRSGNVVWIAPQKEIADYEENQAEARLKAQQAADLVSDYIPISYGKAADIAKLLTTGSMQGGGGGGAGNRTRGFLSPRGSVSYDQRTNTLLINDIPEKVKEIRQLVAVLDKPVRQVLIESRIVAATNSFTRELGVKWGVSAFHTNPSGQRIITSDTAAHANDLNNNITDVQTGNSDTLTFPGGLNVNLPASDAASKGGSVGLAILGANYLVDLELSAAQSEGRTEIISSPRVITANQQEADIKQGEQIGYVTYQNSNASGANSGTATVQFKDAVLELKVTPTITADNRVFLKINVNKDALDGFVNNPGGGQVPQISTKSLNTSVLVDNGQTVVLGGIYEITKNNTTAKVPGLGDIPILGYLFRNTSRQDNKAELLIFVTPRILSDNE
ncbi:type IV pilus secretin PilQ [Oleiagrimonas sp. C23AA]|uniref:type IV pilus secretin PilQ n=1 Tax=Oleiagrimonas sp. C23AA TaxID=2719047 RepID=UPI001421954E|nr:type IV pilus secretin PilQ [Oleiagrimonas sp. C23AA]NII09815.1 type IV pilus secretin PilQ [Oleiagrimonas sp. C23AA]